LFALPAEFLRASVEFTYGIHIADGVDLHCDLNEVLLVIFGLPAVFNLFHQLLKDALINAHQFPRRFVFIAWLIPYHWKLDGQEQVFFHQKGMLLELFPAYSALRINGKNYEELLHLLGDVAILKC